MKRSTIALTALALSLTSMSMAQTARVQVIHNCADATAASVDVYLNTTLLIDNFAFRTATGFIDAPAGVQFTVGIAPSNSMSSMDAIATFDYTLMDGETYVLVADGIVSASGYTPAPAFDIKVYAMGREASSMMGTTDVLVHHGSTDAPVVDVVEIGAGAGTVVDNAAYGDFAGYLELPTADYTLDVRDETGAVSVVTYNAPLATLNLADSALVVLASGFLNPANNSNGPAFGLYVALPSGGTLIPLPLTTTSVTTMDALDFSVYPNPSSNEIYVNLGEQAASEIRIVDSKGAVVNSKTGTLTQTVNLDISSLPAGNYTVVISSDKGVASAAFVKK